MLRTLLCLQRIIHLLTHSLAHSLTQSNFVCSIRRHAYVHTHTHHRNVDTRTFNTLNEPGFLGKWNLIVLFGAEITFDGRRKKICFMGIMQRETLTQNRKQNASIADVAQKSKAYALKYFIINQYSYNFNSLLFSCFFSSSSFMGFFAIQF